MLLFIDGFDHYATADITKKWSGMTGSPTIVAAGRRGGSALYMAGASTLTYNFPATKQAIIIGKALKNSGGSSNNVLEILDAGTKQVALRCNTDGSIAVYRDTTLLATSLPGVFTFAAWNYVEIKAVIDNTTGAVEVRVNGSTVIALTNADTQASANAYATQLLFRTASTSNTYHVDDFYVADTTGTVNNDFLGDCRVDAYLPTVDGALSAWTPEPAGVHYTTVDEATPNTTDYVSSATVGNKELFGVPDLINTPLSIFGVQLATHAWKTDAGFREIKNLVRVSGTDYPSSALAVTETAAYKMKVWDQNPATSTAWTDTTVNAAEWGVEVA